MDLRQRIQAMSIPVTATIRQAMQAVDRGALGLALLVEHKTKRFVGLVTDGDIRRALLNGYGLESPVAEVPRPKSKVAQAGMTADKIATLFTEPVRVIPLLNDDGQVVDLAHLDRRVRLPVAEPSMGEKELLYVSECVLTGWVSSAGKFVTRFEEIFANFCNTKYAVAVTNGTAALHLTMVAMGIGPEDEVIIPTLTFIATANAVTYTGAKPIFVDSEKDSWNIDPREIENAVTPRTKAIVPVHLYGHPAEMDPIMEIAHRYGLIVIEDAAEAQGALYKGKKVGSIGQAGCFSFFANKVITTGEGGMIVSDDENFIKKARLLRDHGMSPDRKYWHEYIGYNYRLTNLQAAIGVAQMEKIDVILNRKREIAQKYKDLLKDVQGIILPIEKEWVRSIYWLFTFLIDEDYYHIRRDVVMESLNNNGIEVRPVFYPIHQMPPYKVDKHLPIAEKISRTGISLPSSITLEDDELQHTTSIIKSILLNQ